MSKRIERTLRKRFVIFCEGDTEYNYINGMRKNQGVELVLKPVNMGGGGYSNFLKKIKTEPQSNCLAKFIIVDADRFLDQQDEMQNFKKLLQYCIVQNQKGNIPHFLIVDNPDFEYIACLHAPDYTGQNTHKFLTDIFSIKNIGIFKSNGNVYELLNKNPMSYHVLLDSVRNKKKILQNEYDIKKKTFEVVIRRTIFNEDLLSVRGSNIEEFFDVIDW